MRRIRRGDLDHRQHVGDRIHPGAAVFGRHLDPHQPVLAEQPDVVQRKFPAFVESFCTGRDFFVCDAARDVLDQQLLFGETEIHVNTST